MRPLAPTAKAVSGALSAVRAPPKRETSLMRSALFQSLLSAILLLLISGCSGAPEGTESSESPLGVLELGLRSDLDGVRYQLDASFVVSGAEAAPLLPRPGEAILSRALSPGSYAVQLNPGYQVLQDRVVVLTPIDSELLSDATQTFEIVAANTTRVSYRFIISAGALTFGGD